MKIKECKRKAYSVGFIDPKRVHMHSLENWPEETETNILRFLTFFDQVTVGENPYGVRILYI